MGGSSLRQDPAREGRAEVPAVTTVYRTWLEEGLGHRKSRSLTHTCAQEERKLKAASGRSETESTTDTEKGLGGAQRVPLEQNPGFVGHWPISATFPFWKSTFPLREQAPGANPSS